MAKVINSIIGFLAFFGIIAGIISLFAIIILFIGNADIDVTTHGAVTPEEDWPETIAWIKIWAWILLSGLIACLPIILSTFLNRKLPKEY